MGIHGLGSQGFPEGSEADPYFLQAGFRVVWEPVDPSNHQIGTNDCGKGLRMKHLEMNGMATCSNSFPIKLRYSKESGGALSVLHPGHAQSKELLVIAFYCKKQSSVLGRIYLYSCSTVSPCAASCVPVPIFAGARTYDVRFGNALLELKSSPVVGFEI